jgi:hypothetical protein
MFSCILPYHQNIVSPVRQQDERAQEYLCTQTSALHIQHHVAITES